MSCVSVEVESSLELVVVAGEDGSGDIGGFVPGSFFICGDVSGEVTEDAALDDEGDWTALRLRGVICIVRDSIFVMRGIWGGLLFVERGLIEVGCLNVVGICGIVGVVRDGDDA